MEAVGERPRRAGGFLRVLCGALGVALLSGAWLLGLGAWNFSSDLQCQARAGQSGYGEAGWSWLPLGTTCRWTEAMNGFDRVEEPGWALTIVVAGLGSSGLGLLATSAVRSGGGRAGRPLAPAAGPGTR